MDWPPWQRFRAWLDGRHEITGYERAGYAVATVIVILFCAPDGYQAAQALIGG